MNLRKLDGIHLNIIESLPCGDLKTGSYLRDELRQLWLDTKDDYFSCDLYSPQNFAELEAVLAQINKKVTEEENKIPIIQIECHGSSDGLMISSKERVPWFSLFDMLRPINVASHDLLMLHLSMCSGEAIIRAIDPQKRSPFRATIGHEGDAYPYELIDSWLKLFSNYSRLFCDDSIGFHAIAMESGFIYYNQEFIFDAHFDLAYLAPNLFACHRMNELCEMYQEEGPLAMDTQLYQKWVAQKQEEIKLRYRDLFCFADVKKENESIYLSMKNK